MSTVSDELRALAHGIIESHRTGFSVAPSTLLRLADRLAPLTDSQIDALWENAGGLTTQQKLARREIVRTTERAHGIL